MTSRTHDNFRHNFWTWVDPPPCLNNVQKNCTFLKRRLPLVPAPQGRSITASRALFHSFLFTFSTFLHLFIFYHLMKSQLFFTRLIKWTFCYYWPSFFQGVGNLKSSNRKLAFSWLQMSGLQTFQKFDKTALRCLIQYCVMLAFLNKIEVILISKCFISSSNIDLSRSKECVHSRQHFPKRWERRG